MSERQVIFLAGWVRVLLGLAALIVLPAVNPGMRAHRLLLAGYVVFALVEQALIWRDLGGKLRSFVAGVVDMALLTFLVHRLGSVSTPAVSLYFFGGVMNALAVGLRVGVSQAAIGSVFYGTVVLAESAGSLPYGPDAPPWAVARAPAPADALTAVAVVALMLVGSTSVVGALRHAVRSRELELARLNAQLAELSRLDPLTQLYNRRHLVAELEVHLGHEESPPRLALLMIDLDGFKRINDEAGHLRGDALLQDISAELRANTRQGDVVSRYGGDEFVILLSDTTAERAEAAAERLVACVREVGARFDPARPVSASVGLAFARRGDTVAALLRRADRGAYDAKQRGGDRKVCAA